MKTFKERLFEERQKYNAGSLIIQDEYKQMDETEAIIYLVWYNEWRKGEIDELPLNPETLTEPINTIVNEYKKRNL